MKEVIRETRKDSWFLGALFLIFLTLKLTNQITWSWWWVTAPLWAPVALIVAAFMCLGLVILWIEIYEFIKR